MRPAVSGARRGPEKRCREKVAASWPLPAGTEVDFVLIFTIDFVHRRLTRLIKMSFRPIICKGAPLSFFFSSLRTHIFFLFLSWNTLPVLSSFFLLSVSIGKMPSL